MKSIGRIMTPKVRWMVKNTRYDQRRMGSNDVVTIVVKHKNTNHPAITTGAVRRAFKSPA
jgi:hypothetical protein